MTVEVDTANDNFDAVVDTARVLARHHAELVYMWKVGTIWEYYVGEMPDPPTNHYLVVYPSGSIDLLDNEEEGEVNT